MRRALPRVVAPALLLALAQCSSLDAFEGPQPSAGTHSLCYNGMATDDARLHVLAKQACSGAVARLVDRSLDMSACPILMPMRLSFACAK